jgi:bis(5'-nucleosidyl)-tetraphosphatase
MESIINKWRLNLSMSKTQRAAGILLFRESPREYLVLLRKKRADLAKGKLEKGESDRDAALREVYEETGIKDISLFDGFEHEVQYSFKVHSGEIEKTFICFLGKVERDVEVTISKEHVGYSWLAPEAAEKMLEHKNLQQVLIAAEKFLNN